MRALDVIFMDLKVHPDWPKEPTQQPFQSLQSISAYMYSTVLSILSGFIRIRENNS